MNMMQSSWLQTGERAQSKRWSCLALSLSLSHTLRHTHAHANFGSKPSREGGELIRANTGEREGDRQIVIETLTNIAGPPRKAPWREMRAHILQLCAADDVVYNVNEAVSGSVGRAAPPTIIILHSSLE